MQQNKAILVFGVGELQKSIINRAKLMGLYVVGIDPCPTAACRGDVDTFEVIGGQDYEGTLAVARKYSISAVVTAATDKPLVMMARIAKELHLPFYTEEAANWSTDKFHMKSRFLIGGVPCAKGKLIASADEANDFQFPVIVKPRDNSGSRGVIYCCNKKQLQKAITEARSHSCLDMVLVEEFIEGQEYSIESLHYDGLSEVIQFTEKKTTTFPYNVELGHKQPALLTHAQQEEIRDIISKIGECMCFENCPSHTELKINKRGIFVIETSPRLGGDYITSHLVPLSTGINIEDQLLHIALGEQPNIKARHKEMASGVCFFNLPQGTIQSISPKLYDFANKPSMRLFDFKLHVGDTIPNIANSINRYGEFIVSATTREDVDNIIAKYKVETSNLIKIV